MRLPAHLEVGGLIRTVQAAGGFATVIKKGERDAGTLLIICCENGTNARAYERMPQPDGTRKWSLSRSQDTENPDEFWDYCSRRHAQDPDLWVVELDIANGERFIDNLEV
ncbi:hypothetical protein FHS61_000975 [Altererythrobacter atlanticus]|uniref:Uncharacterized protein n=1 Tax=Croceibacterium atlanticum TaxID=1267766 RepID=A0A0F7KS91_9SPHN|nr:DUF1491 family protein [Croceibacterium atlanticum]AKH43323.1 hypothetical protein WYH_02291 [Croceibacterium atlanticum]MBB5731971.1 hypothetical protein [Croceibacterium atlanticum]